MPEEKEEHRIVVRLGYDEYLVMPYDAGVLFMQSLKDCQKMKMNYSNEVTELRSMNHDDLSFSVINNKQYKEYKASYTKKVLGVQNE